MATSAPTAPLNQNPAAKKYVNDWGVNNYGGIFVDYYPTQDGVMNTTGALNMGAYADPTANKLMAQSIVAPTTAAIQKEVGYFAKQQPVLYFPVQDNILAVSNKVGGLTDGFLEMTQQQINRNAKRAVFHLIDGKAHKKSGRGGVN